MARREPRLFQRRAEQAWRMSISCAVAKAVATCLLCLRCAHGSDGDTPLSPPRRVGCVNVFGEAAL